MKMQRSIVASIAAAACPLPLNAYAAEPGGCETFAWPITIELQWLKAADSEAVASGGTLKHVPANLLSIGAIDFGILVDGAVVMVENIYRRLALNEESADRQSVSKVIISAAAEVDRPIFYAVAVIVAGFLPIYALSGPSGELFRPMADTTIYALLGSLVLTLTVIPVLCMVDLRRGVKERVNRAFEWLRDRYATINWAASYIAPVFILEGVLFLIASVTNALGFEQRRPADSIGYLVLGFALLGLPMLAPLQGHGWVSSEVFGIAPDPTVVATVGVLLLARGRLVPWLLPIPMLWCLLSGMTLQTMGEPQAWAPYTAVALAAMAWIWRMLSYARR